MTTTFEAIAHDDLGAARPARMRALFDAEYRAEHGDWDPDAPYGYAPADVHVLALDGDALLGHVGFQRRTIAVGDAEVLVAGTGGVLVADAARGSGLGVRLMQRAQDAMREAGVAFGYLGCRPAVVPFYESAGWRRIHALGRHVARHDPSRVVESDDAPLLVCAALREVDQWPAGDVDLRGLPW